MAVEGSDANLNEAAGEPALHYPGEGRGVGMRVALEIVVEIRVRIEVKDVDRPVDGCDPFEDGEADRMVAAQHDRCCSRGGGCDRRFADEGKIPFPLLERQIAPILQGYVDTELEAVFGAHVAVVRAERRADQRRRRGRTAQEGGMAVGRCADQPDARVGGFFWMSHAPLLDVNHLGVISPVRAELAIARRVPQGTSPTRCGSRR
jgi:hypothetical protein